MEFLKASRRKSLFSEALHVALNAALAAAIFALVSTGSSFLALALVLVSKWRILAVRPRYWWANMLANIVDLSVSVSVIVLMYLAGSSPEYALVLQAGIAVLYALWLIALKPRSSERWIAVQAGTSLVLGSWAVMALSHATPQFATILLTFVVAYGAARHVLVAREEDQPSLLAMVFGLFVAEISWVAYHWTVAYGATVLGDLKLSQAAIIVGLVGFLALRLYGVATTGKSFRSVDAVAPTVFVVLVIAALTLFFSAGAGII